MAISFVGSATGTNSIASMPAHQAGDLLLFFAYRDGNVTAPPLPSGYTNKGIRIFSVSRNGGREFTIRSNRTGKV